jgi:hypothetical protein
LPFQIEGKEHLLQVGNHHDPYKSPPIKSVFEKTNIFGLIPKLPWSRAGRMNVSFYSPSRGLVNYCRGWLSIFK